VGRKIHQQAELDTKVHCNCSETLDKGGREGCFKKAANLGHDYLGVQEGRPKLVLKGDEDIIKTKRFLSSQF